MKEICDIEDPSKIILTLTRGVLNMLSLANNGRFSDYQSWPEIRIEFGSKQHNLVKQMRLFERIARMKKYSDH